jgi:hypothetical protein
MLFSLELISQNQPAMEQCFSLITNQHQHQPKIQPTEQSQVSKTLRIVPARL